MSDRHTLLRVAGMPISVPTFVDLAARPTAVIRLKVACEEMGSVFGPAVQEVVGALLAQNLSPDGSAFAHHFQCGDGFFDFEVGFFIQGDAPVAATGRVQPGTRPAMHVVQTAYTGPYEGLHEAWCSFNAWIGAQPSIAHAAASGLSSDNAAAVWTEAVDLWEHYSVGPHMVDDAAQYVTDLVRPLKATGGVQLDKLKKKAG